MAFIKHLFLVVVFGCFGISVYGQAGGFTNPGQDVFRWDADSAAGTSVSSLIEPFAGGKTIPCISNDGVNLSSANSYLRVGTGNAINSLINANSFTFEGMFRPAAVSGTTTNNYVLDRTNSNTYEGTLQLSVNRGKISLQYYDAGTSIVKDIPGAPVGGMVYTPSGADEFMHVAFTKTYVSGTNTTTVRLYYNGTLVSTAVSTATYVCTFDYDLGENTASDSYIGLMDNIRVWTASDNSGARTATQVNAYAFSEITAGTNLSRCVLFNNPALPYDDFVAGITFANSGTTTLSDCSFTRSSASSIYSLVSSSKGQTGFSVRTTPVHPLTSNYSNRYIYAVIGLPSAANINLPQVIYKEGNSQTGYVLYMYNQILTFLYYYNGAVVARVSSYDGLNIASNNVIEAIVTGNNTTGNKIALYVNRRFYGESAVFTGNFNFTGTNSEASFGAASTGVVLYDESASAAVSYTAGACPFKGKLYEYVVRSSENKSQQVLTTNFLTTYYGAMYMLLPVPATDIKDYYDDQAGMYRNQFGGYVKTNSTDYQLTSNSDLRVLCNTDDDSYALWAHNGASDATYDLGYNSNSQNAPLNVKLQQREWLVYGYSKPANTYGFSATISVPASKYQGLIPAGQELVAVIDTDLDGSYRNGSYTVVLKLNAAGTEYTATDLQVYLQDVYSSQRPHFKVRIGYLNQYEFAAAFPGNYLYVGKGNGYDKPVSVSTNNLLGISKPAGFKVGDYLLVQDNNLALAFNSNLTMNDNAGAASVVKVTDRIWRFNVYGTPGAVDITFLKSMLPALPGGTNQYAIVLDQDGVFDAATSKVIALTDIALYRKVFFQAITDGYYMKLAAVNQVQLQAKGTPTEIETSTIALNTTLSLNAADQYSFDVVGGCPTSKLKSVLKVTFNTGVIHTSGDLPFTVSANIQVIGYSDFGMTSVLFTDNNVLALDATMPEKIWNKDILGYYPMLKKVKVVITAFTACSEPLVTPNLRFKLSIEDQDKFQTPTTLSSVIRDLNVARASADAASERIFSWSSEQCPTQYYQVQILRLYNQKSSYDLTPGFEYRADIAEETIDAAIDWSKALTLETPNTSVQMLLTEGTGFYVWRVRPIGNYYPGGVSDSRNWGNWSTDNYPLPTAVSTFAKAGLTANAGAILTSTGNTVLWYDQFDRDKNFSYSRSFTEGGNIHEGITYASALGQPKQNIVRLNSNGTKAGGTDQELIVSQTVYDFAGRAALNSLPAPVANDNDISYQEMFLKQTGQLYTPFNFDVDDNNGIEDANDKYKNPDPINDGAMNTYYSDANSDPTIPSADNYGFTRVLFNNDGTNQVTEQSGVGPVHALTTDRVNSHTVKITDGGVTDEELIIVFGDEAPAASTVFKTVTTDQNNISSITYTNKEGQVIATCLAKRVLKLPDGTTDMPYYTDALDNTLDPLFIIPTTILVNKNLPFGNGGLQASRTLVLTETTPVTLEYKITPSLIQNVCGNYCATCGYVLNVQITDAETGVSKFTKTQTLAMVSKTDNSCTAVEVIPVASTVITLPAGKYIVSRQIVPDMTEAAKFANDIIQGEDAKMTQITTEFYTLMSAPGITYALAFAAYKKLIEDGYTDARFDAQLFDENGVSLLNTVSGTGPFSGVLKRGYRLVLTTSCCTLNILVELPAPNPCDDPAIVNQTTNQVNNTMAASYAFAEAMMGAYAAEKNIDVTAGGFNYDAFKILADPVGGTLTADDWSGSDFKTMIYNMRSSAYLVTKDQCKKMWTCWNASAIAIGNSSSAASASAQPENSSAAIDAQRDAAIAEGGETAATTASSIGSTLTVPAVNIVELVLDCYGRSYVGWANDKPTYKYNAFKVFFRLDVPTSGTPHHCDQVFCAGDITAPVTTANQQQVLCAPTGGCIKDYMTYGGNGNIIQLRINNAGTVPPIVNRYLTHTDYQALKGCLQGYANTPSPATNLDPLKLIADAQINVQTMIKQCKDQCQARDGEFRTEMLRVYDPGNTGTYKYYNTGPELAVNGTFDVNLNSWYRINGAAFGTSDLSVNGKYKSSGDLNYAAGIKTGQILQSGKKYRLVFELKNNIAYPAGTKIFIKNNGVIIYTITDALSYTESIVFTTTSISGISFETEQVYTYCAPCLPPYQLPVDFTLDNISIREVLLENPLTTEDVCCMAQSLTDYCKQQCQLDVVTQDCNADGTADKMVRIGTDAQIAKWSAIMYGGFQLSETSTVGGTPDQCGAGWEKIVPDVNLTTPAACLNGTPTKKWDAAYTSGNVLCIEKDDQNNMYVLYDNRVLTKIDPTTGALIWYKSMYTYGGPVFSRFICLGNDEFLFAGTTFSNGGDVLLSRQKYDGTNITDAYANGFTRNYGGSGDDYFIDIVKIGNTFAIGAGSYSIPNTTDQNLDLIHGSRKTSPNFGSNDYWFFKMDALGNVLPNSQMSFGGSGYENLNFLRTDDSGNFYLIGTSASPVGLPGNRTVNNIPYGQGYWIVKIKANLSSFSELEHSNADYPQDVVLTTEDNYVYMYYNSPSSYPKISLKKFQGGMLLWNKLVLDAHATTVANQLYKSSDGGFYILGYIFDNGTTTPTSHDPLFGNNDYFLVKADASGNYIWDRSFGGSNAEYIPPMTNYRNLLEINGTLVFGYNSFSEPNSITGIGNRTAGYIGPDLPFGWLVGLSLGSNTSCVPKHLCIKWLPVTIPGDPITPDPMPPVTENDPSTPTSIQTVLSNLDLQRAQCGAQRYNSLVDQYLTACMNGTINDLLKVSYSQAARHYTLYYYDRAGNLSRTVPPAGVRPVTLDANGLNRQVHTTHKLVTTYEYNSIGQLISYFNPDGGTTNFVYNTIGQLRFSQNARQALANTCSYSKYDELGRIIEVGECNLATAGVAFSAITPYADANGVFTAYGSTSFPTTGNAQQTISVYTTAATQASYLDKGQTHLRNRISYSYTYALNGERAVSYYSYDPHGNVNWMMQEIPGMSRNTIGYDYDLISNKVLCAKYNEGQNDAFYHKYSYDADNRVTAVLTSRDRIVWDKDASYTYYKHGIAKRTALGEDNVQGLDYTFTIQGWLKGINTPSLAAGSATDDGGASSTFAGDEYGMTLNYFKGDFTRTASPIYNPKTGAAGANTFVSDANRQLFNGNINSWVSRVQQEYRDYLSAGNSATTVNNDKFTTANYYSYDDLNRITASAFSEFSSTGATSANGDKYSRLGTTGKYATAYSYDANGNINTLKRYSVDGVGAAKLMDNMTYTYKGSTAGAGATDQFNQLTAIQDAVPDADFSDDIDNLAGTRYTYDAIGNLIYDAVEGIDITWTVYGKVASVKRHSPTSNTKSEVRYTYDATGQRIKKEVNTQPYDGSGIAQRLPDKVITTFYVHDASGNVMSIYERKNTAVAGQAGYYIASYDQKEIPIYGTSRVGMYTPDVSEATVATKKFQASDLDNMLYERALSPRTNYDPYWSVASRENININNTSAASIGISSTTLYGMTNSGDAATSVYTATPTKAFTFSGKTGNAVAHALNASGQVQFTAFTATSYFGAANKLIILSGSNGRMMKGSEDLNADSKSQIAITQVPGSSSKYYLITKDLTGNVLCFTIDMSLPGYGTAGAPQGELQGNGLVYGLFPPYLSQDNAPNVVYGKSFLVRENKNTGTTQLYATRYIAPVLPADECGHVDLLVYTLPSVIETGITAEVMCSPIGFINSEANTYTNGEEQGELAFNAKGDELLYYSQKKRLGWFSHQAAEVLSYELGYDGKIAKNAVAAKYTIPVADPTLPGSSEAVSADGRFIYYSKDQLYQTNGSAAHIWRYDTRNGTNAEVSGQNIAGDLRNLYSGLLIEIADNKSQTAKSLQETDQGITQINLKNVIFSVAGGQVANWPLQNFRMFGVAKGASVSVRRINKKMYELSDHLGNVTVVVSDQKKATGNIGAVVTTIAKVASYTNYYAFGMAVKPRSNAGSNQYRYGYNGQEKETETGENIYSAEFWEYDARIARRWNVDPVVKEWESPYACFNNDPINRNDVNGLDGKPVAKKLSTNYMEINGKVFDFTPVIEIFGKRYNDNFMGRLHKKMDIAKGRLSNGLAFVNGALNAFFTNQIGGAFRGKNNNSYYNSGQTLGDVIALAQGMAEADLGATIGTGGVVVIVGSGGTLVIPGGIAAAGGGLMSGHGILVSATAANNLSKHSLSAHGGNSSGGGGSKPTPNNAPDEFTKLPNNQGYYHNKTGEIYKKSTTSHGNKGNEGLQWKVWPKGTKDFGSNSKKSGTRTTVDGNGNIIGN